jgi:predicted metalloprotease
MAMAGVEGPARTARRARGGRTALRALVAGAVAVILAGCSASIGGQAAANPELVPPKGKPIGYTPSSFDITYAEDDSEADQIARDALDDVIAYYNSWYPEVFGHDFQPPAHYYSIGPDDGHASGCMSGPDDQSVVNNAFYCPAGDEITYWRPKVQEFADDYGDVQAALILAHELGHTIQDREGMYDVRSIVAETQADCFAGTWLKSVVDGKDPHFTFDQSKLDGALLGWTTGLSYEVGSDPNDPMQHGSMFDRVTAVQEGYEQGPQACRDNFNDNRLFTSMEFTDDNASDDGQGNQKFEDTVSGAIDIYDSFYASAFQSLGGSAWTPPKVLTGGSTQSACAAAELLTYCAADNTVVITDEDALRDVHDKDGDFATLTAIGLVYGIAAITELGYSQDDPNALLAASCLTGALAGEMLTKGNSYGTVSPGDFDEATVMLLTAGPDNPVVDTGDQSAFNRLDAFRNGVNGGIGNCGVVGQ